MMIDATRNATLMVNAPPRPPWPKLPTREQLLKAIRTQLQG